MTIHKKVGVVVLGLALLLPTLAVGETNTATDPANTSATSQVRPTERSINKDARPAFDANTEEKMRRAKMLAGQEIERRIKALASTTDKINHMDRVTDKFKEELRARLEAEKQSIEALRARIQASEDPEALKTDVQSITKTHRTFALVVPKAHIAAAAEKVVTMTAIMGEMGLKLKNRIDAAEAEGVEVATLREALTSLSVHIDAANAHARAAIEGTANLSPDNGDPVVFEANKAALQVARKELAAAHEELKAGRQDIKTIVDAFKANRPQNNAAEPAQTQSAPVE